MGTVFGLVCTILTGLGYCASRVRKRGCNLGLLCRRQHGRTIKLIDSLKEEEEEEEETNKTTTKNEKQMWCGRSVTVGVGVEGVGIKKLKKRKQYSYYECRVPPWISTSGGRKQEIIMLFFDIFASVAERKKEKLSEDQRDYLAQRKVKNVTQLVKNNTRSILRPVSLSIS